MIMDSLTVLRYMENIKALQNDGLFLRYIREQTVDLCLTAVRQNGLALKHVVKQTEVIVKAAVENNHDALRYVNQEFMYLFDNM